MNAPLSQPLVSAAEPGLGDAEFRELAQFVHQQCGIVLTDAKRGLVVSRLGRRLRQLEFGSFTQYCRFVRSEAGAGEREQLISALTTNVTRFFREGHHFNALRNDILPPLIARARRGGRVRLWSAGCSTGEEPYSIAMEVLDLCAEAGSLDIRLLATDIDPQVIARGIRGVYAERDLADVSETRRARHFEPCGTPDEDWQASASLRGLVAFAPLNLIGPWPMRGSFDVIFCRNVVIYFDGATQDRLWRRFAATMPPGGTLFIGHSERMSRSAEPLFTSAGITQYRRTTVNAENHTTGPDARGDSA